MFKRFKTVSMMLFLLGSFTGAAYALPSSANATMLESLNKQKPLRVS